MSQDHSETTTLQLLLAWGFVGIPLVLGVLETILNSLKLFQSGRRLGQRLKETASKTSKTLSGEVALEYEAVGYERLPA